MHEDVPPPSETVPGLPPYVDALVARATARDRELRPADAQVLLHQVRRVRGAIDHGVLDDPELTQDLLPAQHVEDTDSIDYVDEDPLTIVSTAAAAQVVSARHRGEEDEGSDHEGTTVIAAGQGALLPAARPSRPGGGDEPDSQNGPRRSRRGLLLLAAVLLLATIAGVVGWYFGMGRYTTTPGVINLTAAQAQRKVEASGLSFRVGSRAYSETVAEGLVVTTDPKPGTNILKDGTVVATISRGPERYDVPVLKGATLAEAKAALRSNHLTLGDVSERYSETVAKGVVLRSDPESGTEVKAQAAVDLVVSKGPRPVQVPDFTGKPADRAEQVLTERGLEVEITRENSDTVPEGDVISQTPSSGTLFRGDTVKLVASKGPLLVQVPAVRGVGLDEATRRLQEAGFQVQTQRSDMYVGLEYVVQSDPQEGTMAPQGSVVTLFLV